MPGPIGQYGELPYHCEAADSDNMITEIALVEIKGGTENDYEAGLAKAASLPSVPAVMASSLHRS